MSVTSVAGFEAAGIASGIKASGALDLSMVATDDRQPVTAVGVFTTNLVEAAPVQVSRWHLEDGRAAAVVLNSGNANAATGDDGLQAARDMCALTAAGIGCRPEDVLVCQTGLIGIPLGLEPLRSGIPKLATQLAADAASATLAAEAMMTTDTVSKETSVATTLTDGTVVTVGGMAKGAAMLAPAMATMLAVLTTDAEVEHAALQRALQQAVDASFNSMVVDGCMSTNDTVLVLANGRAGNAQITEDSRADLDALTAALTDACTDLARQMAGDAEGATKFVTLTVTGARSEADAQRAARQVACSQLVQSSLYGSQSYWGRVIAELGASGAQFDPDDVTISYQGIANCRGGVAHAHDESELERRMQVREIAIDCDLGAGDGTALMWFSDLTHAYIDENMGLS